MQKEELIKLHTLFEKLKEEMERSSAPKVYGELASSSENRLKRFVQRISRLFRK